MTTPPAAARIGEAGGEITVPIFSFPGGRRFHFRDPADGLDYLLFTASDPASASSFNGVVGRRRRQPRLGVVRS